MNEFTKSVNANWKKDFNSCTGLVSKYADNCFIVTSFKNWRTEENYREEYIGKFETVTSFLYVKNEDLGVEWIPPYNPCTILYRAGTREIIEDREFKRLWHPYFGEIDSTGLDWSQIYISERDFLGDLRRGDFESIFWKLRVF